MVLVDADTKIEERKELVGIYNNLSPPLKKQLLTLATVIDTTRQITLNEDIGEKSKIHKQD